MTDHTLLAVSIITCIMFRSASTTKVNDFKQSQTHYGCANENSSTASLTEYSKSALTDYANRAKDTIDWKKTTVINREQDRSTR